MGELAIKVLKVAQIVIIVAMAVGIITMLTVFGDEFSQLWNEITNSGIFAYVERGFAIGKWLFGSVPVLIILDTTVAYVGFVFGSRAVSFIKSAIFDR